MSASPKVRPSNGIDGEPSIERARALCAEALAICDALNLPREIAAKVQETITAIEQSPRK